jgi:hypothetical protein
MPPKAAPAFGRPKARPLHSPEGGLAHGAGTWRRCQLGKDGELLVLAKLSLAAFLDLFRLTLEEESCPNSSCRWTRVFDCPFD